jgi:hypothetical protein
MSYSRLPGVETGHCLSNVYEQIVMFQKKRGNVADL